MSRCVMGIKNTCHFSKYNFVFSGGRPPNIQPSFHDQTIGCIHRIDKNKPTKIDFDFTNVTKRMRLDR